jgi:beta-galactosidase
VELCFDGVYMGARVWVNGTLVGGHEYGYTPWNVDLTEHLHKDGDNVVAVRVSNIGANSRWYSGSGIYRHVSVDATGATRLARFGVGITTPVVAVGCGEVRASLQIEGSRPDAYVRTRITAPDGREVAHSSTPAAAELVVEVRVGCPELWAPETPSLYQAETELVVAEDVIDHVTTTFGIREVRIDAGTGLVLNGQGYKLRGGCVHHDNGLLGAAVFDRAETRRVELLKARGYNAVRCACNPPSATFLDACDRLGMLVIDEAFDTWYSGKTSGGYHQSFAEYWQEDLDTMVLRDRNHPSVVMWSIGNEMVEKLTPLGVETQAALAEECRRLDPTRPVTAALDGFCGRPVVERSGQPDQPATKYLDVVGYNYRWAEYAREHEMYPGRVMYGSESQPRHLWSIWELVEKHPYVIGDFVWTAIDYLGEPGLGGCTPEPSSGPRGFFQLPDYPWYVSYCGDIDIIGQQKAASYARDVLWGISNLEVAVRQPVPEGMRELTGLWGWPDEVRSWTWPGSEGRELLVRAYTSGDRVTLVLNGKGICDHEMFGSGRWAVDLPVAYEPGELVAIAWQDGHEIGRRSLLTAGAPSKLLLRPEQPTVNCGRNDIAYVGVEVSDNEGKLVPDATVPVSLTVRGAGELIALGSANPLVNGSFQRSRATTFRGRCLAIIRPAGKPGHVRVDASSPGLYGASTSIATV